MIFNFIIGFVSGAMSLFLVLLLVAWLKLRSSTRLPKFNKVYKGRITAK